MEKASRGQFCEFIGKLLVLMNDEKVGALDKTKIQKLINSLSSGDGMVIENVIRFLNNDCRLQIIGNHEIYTDAVPALPFAGAEIEFHKKSGVIVFNPSKVNLHLSPNQKDGKTIQGHKLRKELEKENVLNACVLDYLLANPHLIPEEWKGKFVFFWGTIYRDSDGSLYVRCMYWFGDLWQSNYRWLGNDWDGDDPSAVSAS